MVIVKTKQAVREQLLKNSRLWVKNAFSSLQERVTRSSKKKNQQESAGIRNQEEALQEKIRSVLPPVEEAVIDDIILTQY